jgi:hypothetical protein
VSLGAPRFQPRVRILYEDSRAATNGFGLHDFVLANVRDVIGERGHDMEIYRLRKLIEAIPKKSDTKVLSALERDAEGLYNGHTAIVAWLDDDKIHRPLRLGPGLPASTLIDALRKKLPSSIRPEAVWIHLMRGNVEQFLRRIDGAQPKSFDETTLAEALDKVPTARDLCFHVAAAQMHAAWRKVVRDADPGFDETIRYLADLAARETWPPW